MVLMFKFLKKHRGAARLHLDIFNYLIFSLFITKSIISIDETLIIDYTTWIIIVIITKG